MLVGPRAERNLKKSGKQVLRHRQNNDGCQKRQTKIVMAEQEPNRKREVQTFDETNRVIDALGMSADRADLRHLSRACIHGAV